MAPPCSLVDAAPHSILVPASPHIGIMPLRGVAKPVDLGDEGLQARVRPCAGPGPPR